MSVDPSEFRIGQRFVDWLSQHSGDAYVITGRPDPPDFLLSSQREKTWLEITDIYSSDEEAKFLNTPEDKKLSLTDSDFALVLRLLNKLRDKLSKLSYASIFAERGKGILLLTCQYVLFDENVLEGARDALRSFVAPEKPGFFRIAYFEYRMPNGDRFYDVIYQS